MELFTIWAYCIFAFYLLWFLFSHTPELSKALNLRNWRRQDGSKRHGHLWDRWSKDQDNIWPWNSIRTYAINLFILSLNHIWLLIGLDFWSHIKFVATFSTFFHSDDSNLYWGKQKTVEFQKYNFSNKKKEPLKIQK